MSKRKNDQVDGDGIHDDDKVQALKAKRVKGKERVTFADGHRVREFNVDAELEDNQVDELVEGDRITRVRGEEDVQQWSDDEIEVEPFNLKSENEEGYFDKNGNYVEHKMEKGVEDAWLDEYDEKWAKKMEHNKSRITSKAMEEDNEVVHDKVALLKTVLNFLQTKESATAALKRLGGGGKTATTKKKVGKGAKDGKDMTDFYKLSDAIDALLHGGYNNIYSDKKEQVQEELDNELANQASSSSSNEVMWEYKGQDGALFGPYTSANMRDWRAQGYFTGESAVPIRKVKSAEEEDDIFASSSSSGDDFVSSDSIDFSQYP